MKVVSINRGEVTTVNYQRIKVKTGIFKYPVNEPILLGETDVEFDTVVDRRFHAGIDKAVYAYSLDHYPFWKVRFPDLDWNYGMFGENLTIEGMDESKMLIGSIYEVGEARIQVCQPRQPCFKLGIRFKTQSILKPFVNGPYPGVYFRVLKTGNVNVADKLKLLTEELDSPSITEVYQLLYHTKPSTNTAIQSILNCVHLPKALRESILQKQSQT